METFIVTDAAGRLDTFLAERLPHVSRARLQKLMGTGAILLNGQPAKSSTRLRVGDTLTASIPDPRPVGAPMPETLPLNIVYEDNDLLVMNKGKGIVVHPAPGAETGTLVNALLGRGTRLSAGGGPERPGIVHRLDKDTTGLLVVAKTDAAHANLQAQLQARTMTRKYNALLWGHPPFENAVIDAPIVRHPGDRKRMAVADSQDQEGARSAITELTVLTHMMEFAWVEAVLHTGRTHQIRVHCQFAGFPVVGDPAYGGRRKIGALMPSGPVQQEANALLEALHGQALHAFSLSFQHPRTGQPMQFDAPLPDEIARVIDFFNANQDIMDNIKS